MFCGEDFESVDFFELKDDLFGRTPMENWVGLFAHTPQGIVHKAGIRYNPLRNLVLWKTEILNGF